MIDIERAIETLKDMKGVFDTRSHKQYSLLALDLAIAALEKQIPKKPIEEEKQYSEDYGFNSDILCPVCNNYIGYYTEAMCKPEYMQYCNECGQRIDDDWRVEE